MTDKFDRFAQFEDLWDVALAHPPADRAAFLRDACGDDDGLRRDLEAALVHVGRAEEFLEQPLATVAAQILDPPTETVLTGRRLNTLMIGPLIGAGGMGQVYRARDTELHRDVAVKVLAPEFAKDADRLARFAREARVLASLNHTNIAHIHGVQSSGEVTAIVMELVEGETLAERIARGRIALKEALPIARQIADALEAAHEQGVIHRDLKPANIQLRADGTIKVLDFGLAKTVHQANDDAVGLTNSALLSSVPGVVFGTAAYVAPEQAMQKPVDRRVDMWALGCVLFEMLTGQPAFTGHTRSEVLAKVVEGDPDWQSLHPSTPPAIHRLLRRCLEKDPRRRLNSAAVARLEIDDVASEPTVAVQAATRRGSLWTPVTWSAVGAGVAVLVASMLAQRMTPSESPAPMVAHVRVQGPTLGQSGVHFAIAPNGRTLVFAANYGGGSLLYRRDLDRVDPEPIPGTNGGSDVFFSPDGGRLGFEGGPRSELWAVSLDGTSPQRLLPNQPLRGGTWGGDDTIIFGRVGSGLWLASASGGGPRQLTVPAQGERHELPQMLPGGRTVLFTILSSTQPPQVAVHLLGSGETRTLFEGVGARFVSSGHLVFGRQGRLLAVGFDADSLETIGPARPVRDDVLWSAPGYPQFTTDGGTLAYMRATRESSEVGKSALIWVDRQGRRESIPLEPKDFLLYRLSPRGDRMVVQVGPSKDLWAYDFGRATLTSLTSDRILAWSTPAWMPDGSRVAFMTWFGRDVGLGLVRADGSGQVEELIKNVGLRSFESANPVIHPDGSGVILSGLAPGSTAEDLLFVPLTGERRVETLFHAPGRERNPAVAPNGRFIAYNSDESSRSEVYVRPFPNAGSRKWQVSTEGGVGPVWTRGGSEILYRDAQNRMVAVAVRSDDPDAFDFSKPQPLFSVGQTDQTSVPRLAMCRCWDVTADGERFLLSTPAVEANATDLELILIQNWVEELKRLMPPEP